MKNIAVFCSGSGSNFQSIINAEKSGAVKAKIAALIASKHGIGAIDRAKQHNIPYFVFDKADFCCLDKMYDKIAQLLKSLDISLIVLAGYLTIIPQRFVKAFEGKIINIHPALLPKFGGKGFFGLNVHQAVLAANEFESGCTVHFVDEGTDTGKTILQRKVTVLPDDTAQTLQQRVLEQEHIALPLAIEMLLNGTVRHN